MRSSVSYHFTQHYLVFCYLIAILNVSNIAGRRGDIALLLLPRIIPPTTYKQGRKHMRPSHLESSKAFIDEQPVS